MCVPLGFISLGYLGTLSAVKSTCMVTPGQGCRRSSGRRDS